MAATSIVDDDLLNVRYRAHERYQFGWTDYRSLYGQHVEKVTHDWDQFITNFMGMVIVMIPVTVITYWLWPWF